MRKLLYWCSIPISTMVPKKILKCCQGGKRWWKRKGEKYNRTLGETPEQKPLGGWLKLQREIVLLSNHPADSKSWSSTDFPFNLLLELILRRFCLKMIFIGMPVAQ